MSLRINNNIEAQESLRQLNKAQSMFSTSMQRLSSGKRINSAADDAAGYAISQKLLAQNKGLDQAQSNAQDGVSMVQTASGGLQTIQDMLQRFRQLAVQSANDTNTASDRQSMQAEANQISQEITQIATTTQFNTKNLLDGSLGTTGKELSASSTFAGQYNGAAFGAGNTPALNTGSLAATDTDGSNVKYTLAVTSAGTAATLGANANGSTAAATDYVGDVKVASYSGSGQTQSGVVGGTYNLTIAGANGSATIAVTAGASSGDKFSDVVDKINAVSNQTGVSATFDTTAKTIKLTNDVAGASQSVTASGQDQLLRGLGLLGADTATYSTTDALTAAEQKISTASAVGTDGAATLVADKGPFNQLGTVKLTANGNRFSDASSGFSVDLNSVQGLDNTVSIDFNVSNSGTATLQVGANAGQNLNVSIGSMKAQDLGIASGNGAIDITSQSAASNAIKLIDSAIQTVSTQAATLGAVQNRLSSAMDNLAIQSENMQAAYSSITNVNMAQESTNLATAQILNQSATAMLAQANQAPQGVLKLLG